MSLPIIKNVWSLLYNLSISLAYKINFSSSTIKILMALSTIIWSLVFRCYHFESVFNLYSSFSSHLEACNILTQIKQARSSFNQGSTGLSGGKYWVEDSRLPQVTFSWGLCWDIFRLYYGYWAWFVYFSCCHHNISLIFQCCLSPQSKPACKKDHCGHSFGGQSM